MAPWSPMGHFTRFESNGSARWHARRMAADGGITVRRATDDELDSVIRVCGEALGWSGADDDASFFVWKHVDNPFGRSPIWVAVSDDPADGSAGIVGVRVLMRWELERDDGRVLTMARAVDTATLPSHQGLGIFSRLTMAAVDELMAEGVPAIFNTPNDKSRPGYLKMGWASLGRVPVVVRPRRPTAIAAMARSRVAAAKWGDPTEVGIDPAVAFADDEAVEAALRRCHRSAEGCWSTALTVPYLRWRSSYGPLACRVLPLGDSVADGFVLFRLRRRGELTQLSVLHLAARRAADARRAIARLLTETGADVAMASDRWLGPRSGMIPLPAAGPILTWRTLADPEAVTLSRLDLSLGAIELF